MTLVAVTQKGQREPKNGMVSSARGVWKGFPVEIILELGLQRCWADSSRIVPVQGDNAEK